MSSLPILLYVLAILLIGAGAFLLGRRSAAISAAPVSTASGDPPPVPWISASVWGQRRDWSRFAGVRGPDDTEGPLLGVEAWVVRDDERARSPMRPMANPPPVPKGIDQLTADRLLRTTPEIGIFAHAGHWPVCCSSLTVLVAVQPSADELRRLEPAPGALDAAVVAGGQRERWVQDLASIRAGGRPVHGVNVFHCTQCGRLYGVYCTA